MMWAGAAESVANIASTGEVTFGDAIGLLGPLAHALGKRTGKMVSNGGCFVAGTPVALAALPQGWQGASGDPWAETTWLESFLAEEREFSAPLAMPAPEPAALAVAAELAAAVRVAIEQVPLGARVQTRNPRRWEYDDSLPEPDEATWAKLSLTVQRSDGGLVDAELLRPWAWIELHGLRAGELLPLHLAELEVSGPALVTAIEACPPIAPGAGSVVTARFVTREVHRLVSIDLLGAGGELETLTGTPVHPVWSVDREDWVPLGELVQGETLQGEGGLAVVLSITLSRVAQPVYNLEVHGEHVYQVGELGVLVHNACSGFHHFAPRAWGSDVPYGPKYLSWLDELQHTSVHRGFSDFLKLRTGHFFNSISGNQWQNILDYRTRRALLIEFHQTYAGGAHWNDFVQEVLKARKAG
ncbi:MAG: polymorphic toxin-type HINT domain-containing protein, partial [Planctomycetota bacterium]